MVRVTRAGWVGLALLLGAASSAVAQDNTYLPPPPAVSGYINSPTIITHCLCEERRVASLHDIANDAQKRFDDAQARVTGLKRDMTQARGTLDVNDEEQVEEFSRLSEEELQAEAHLFNDIQPQAHSAVDAYNAASQSYNQQCAGRNFDSIAMAEVRQTLNCPSFATQLPPP